MTMSDHEKAMLYHLANQQDERVSIMAYSFHYPVASSNQWLALYPGSINCWSGDANKRGHIMPASGGIIGVDIDFCDVNAVGGSGTLVFDARKYTGAALSTVVTITPGFTGTGDGQDYQSTRWARATYPLAKGDHLLLRRTISGMSGTWTTDDMKATVLVAHPYEEFLP